MATSDQRQRLMILQQRQEEQQRLQMQRQFFEQHHRQMQQKHQHLPPSPRMYPRAPVNQHNIPYPYQHPLPRTAEHPSEYALWQRRRQSAMGELPRTPPAWQPPPRDQPSPRQLLGQTVGEGGAAGAASQEEMFRRRARMQEFMRQKEEHQRLLKRFHQEDPSHVKRARQERMGQQSPSGCTQPKELEKELREHPSEPESSRKRKRSSFPTSVAPGTAPPERRKECDVCGDDSSRHHLNYGANVCFSCRAFFRRAHQQRMAAAEKSGAADGAMPQFGCKWNGNCVVTVKNRRRCQKCRYDRCLAAGMRPECVLDMAQRKHRFRKALSKREETAMATQPNIFAASPSNGISMIETPPPSSASPTPSSVASEDRGSSVVDSTVSESYDGETVSALPPTKRLKMRYCREMASDEDEENGKSETPGANREPEETTPRRGDDHAAEVGSGLQPDASPELSKVVEVQLVIKQEDPDHEQDDSTTSATPKPNMLDKSTSTDGLQCCSCSSKKAAGKQQQWVLVPMNAATLAKLTSAEDVGDCADN